MSGLHNNIALYAPLALDACTLVIMWKRRVLREYAPFAAFLFFSFVRAVIAWYILSFATYEVYFYAYWWTEPISQALILLTLYASFICTFKSFPRLRNISCTIFLLVTALMLTIAILGLRGSAHGITGDLMAAIMLAWGNLALLRILVAAYLYAASLLLGLPLRRYVLGIMLGHGIGACSILATSVLRTHFGPSAIGLIQHTNLIGSYVMSIIWLLCFIRAEAKPAHGFLPSGGGLHEWEQSLEEFVTK